MQLATIPHTHQITARATSAASAYQHALCLQRVCTDTHRCHRNVKDITCVSRPFTRAGLRRLIQRLPLEPPRPFVTRPQRLNISADSFFYFSQRLSVTAQHALSSSPQCHSTTYVYGAQVELALSCYHLDLAPLALRRCLRRQVLIPVTATLRPKGHTAQLRAVPRLQAQLIHALE